ncbi:MAG TPA: hypothetical protein VK797_23010 [Tepidisphaeraceae bacterium]|jgi:hypothetical protein|nr:hypothetical protein [Tepidisphaeraceae bacterium]
MTPLMKKFVGLSEGMDQRPSRDEFVGINQDSFQAKNLYAWWPIWEPMSNAAKAPCAMDYGPYGLHMTPSVNTLHAGDPQMGTCWFGIPNPAGMAGIFSGQSQSRPYAYQSATSVDPVDFGGIPDTVVLGQAYMATAWIRTSDSALTFTAGDTPHDTYIYSFDRNDNSGYPGHTMGVIMQIYDGSGVNTANAAATMFDNNEGGAIPFGVQSCQVVNDGQWHLICGLYMPFSTSGSGGYNNSWQVILVDGQLGPVSGNDVQGGGQLQPFGISKSQANVGSPQNAGKAAINAVYQFIGSDDDGVSSPFLGLISDHRLYGFSGSVGYPGQPGLADPLAIMSQGLALAQHMYAPETRWELYRTRPNRSFGMVKVGGPKGTATIFLITHP